MSEKWEVTQGDGPDLWDVTYKHPNGFRVYVVRRTSLATAQLISSAPEQQQRIDELERYARTLLRENMRPLVKVNDYTLAVIQRQITTKDFEMSKGMAFKWSDLQKMLAEVFQYAKTMDLNMPEFFRVTIETWSPKK